MNPLLQKFNGPFETPPFEEIKNDHFIPAIQEAIKAGRNEITAITENNEEPTFANTIEALERSGSLLGQVAGIFFNLNSAETNDRIQEIAREISPWLSEYSNDIKLNEGLFKRIKTVFENKGTYQLTPEEYTLLDKTYKSFVRNGINLPEDKKPRLREIDMELSSRMLSL